MSSRADTPELVKLAAKAMQNDPEGPAGELVRAWKSLRAENQRLREEVASATTACNVAVTQGDQARAENRRLREALERAAADLEAWVLPPRGVVATARRLREALAGDAE